MNIVFFSNPDFFGSQKTPQFMSMPRFTNMLAEGMQKRGHKVTVWSPGSTFFGLVKKGPLKKWMGYIDQYIVFPATVRKRIKSCSPDTLFVFTDQAQGPWVPLVSHKNHVMHCHDLLAQFSALGKIKDQPLGWTGKRYQSFIRNGLLKARHFISVSNKTNADLMQVLTDKAGSTHVVYNGLDDIYQPGDAVKSRKLLAEKTGLDLGTGYLMHVGGNQWYKNREGVVELYSAWRSLNPSKKLPLLLIGSQPSASIEEAIQNSPYKNDIHVVSNLSDSYVRHAYSGATLFLFPSLAEGFGWPIAEAMASGCPVLTTNAAPMTEVAGDAAFLIPQRYAVNSATWAHDSALIVDKAVNMTEDQRQETIRKSIENAKRFDHNKALDKIEGIYANIA